MTAHPMGHWGPGASLDRVFRTLDDGGYRPSSHSRDFKAFCPAHAENTGSLHVTYKAMDGGGYRVFLRCFGCQATEAEIAEAMGLGFMDLFDDPPPERKPDAPRPRRTARRPKVGPLPKVLIQREADPALDHEHDFERVQTYNYLDGGGKLHQQVHREHCRVCAKKNFPQSFVVGDELLERKPDGFVSVLYNLPEVLQAIATGEPVWVMEGEKDADTGTAAGLVTTTNPGGAGTFPAELAAVFVGADVNVALDRDAAGWSRGVHLFEVLTEAGAARVRLWLPAPTAPKSDFTDHISADYGVEDLVAASPGQVAALDALAKTQGKLELLRQCQVEAAAQWQAATERAESAPKAAEDHRRYASRWAAEAEVRWDRAATAAEATLVEVERASGNAIDAVALELDGVLEQAEVAVRATHDSAHAPLADGVAERTATLRARAVRPGGGGKVLDLPVAPAPKSRIEQTHRDGSVSWPEYAFLDGGIVRRQWREEGRGEGKEWAESLVPIINLAIHLDEIEMRQAEETLDPILEELVEQHTGDPSQRVGRMPDPAAHVYSWVDPATGRRVRARIPFAEARGGDWLDTIPVSGLSFARDRKGRTEVVRAIAVASRDTNIVAQQRGTGWHHDESRGWCYSHYAGTICEDGVIATPAILSGSLTRYALPLPTCDRELLRSAFYDHSLPLMTQLHQSIGAVLLGVAYKAAVERVPYSPVLVGSPGSGKTGYAALIQHHYGPAWDRTDVLASLTGHGSTPLAMRLAAHMARDALGMFDDATPSGAGGYAGAQQRLGDLIQGFYNQESRGFSSREQELQNGKKPHVTAMFTAEMPPRMGANARRAIILPLDKGDLSIEDLITYDDPASRMARARLVASLIRWAAEDLTGRREFLIAQRTRYAADLRGAGYTTEEAEWAGHVWSGWTLMTSCLRDLGAISPGEQTKLLSQVHLNITAAISAAADPDEPLTLGVRILEALRGSLRAGDLYLTDVGNNACPTAMANRLGWSPVPGLMDGLSMAHSTRGTRLGYVNLELGEAFIANRDLERAVKIATTGLAEPLTLDAGTIRRALRDVGAIRTEPKANGGVALSVKRTIHAESTLAGKPAKVRTVAIILSKLLGEDPDDGDQLDEHQGPVPPPMPWDDEQDLDDTPPPTPTTPTPQQVPAPVDDAEPEEFTMPSGHHATPHRLNDEQDCVWCSQPTRWAVEDVPLHSSCFGDMNRRADELNATTAAAPATTTTTAAATPAPAPQARSTTRQARPRPAHPAPTGEPIGAVVADVDGIHLPDGTVVALPAIQHLGDVAAIAQQLGIGVSQRGGKYIDAGTIVISTALTEQLGLPIDLPEATAAAPRLPEQTFEDGTTNHPVLLEAIADGWDFSGRKDDGDIRLRAWAFAWRGEIRVRLTFQQLLQEPLTAALCTPATMARRLTRFAETMQIAWHVTPHSTGFDLMTHLQHRQRERLFKVRDPRALPAPTRAPLEADLSWTRTPTDAEQAKRYVHLYDRGGSYLAGVSSLELPIGDPVHHEGPATFDPSMPGYWRIRTQDADDWRFPNPLGMVPARRETMWVTTPTLEMATSLDYAPEILEAHTWPEHSRFLDSWYARIRDARTELDTDDVDDRIARTMIKDLYTRTIGMLGSEQYQGRTPFYAPERRHHIVAKARSNLLRQIVKIGQTNDTWPLAVRTDAILYASDEPDPVKAWPGEPAKLGRGLGQYKPERTGLMADQLEFLTGGTWKSGGRDALTAIGELEEGSE